MRDPASVRRVAELVIDDFAEENAALEAHIRRLNLELSICRQMLSIALEMLWRHNVLADAARPPVPLPALDGEE